MTQTAIQTYVHALYQNVLLRAGDAGGLANWTGQAGQGMSSMAMVADFIGSPEARNITAVLRLYDVFFDRAADIGGLTHWAGKLHDGGSLRDLVLAFAGSDEFQARYGALDNAAYVDALYGNLFERAADAGGKAYWIAEIDSGRASRAELALVLSSSAEAKSSDGAATRFAESYLALRSSGVAEPSKEATEALAQKSLADAILELQTVHGTVQNGIIEHANVSRDADGDGHPDAGAANVTTDAQGNFTIVGGYGDIVVTGGTDLTTGNTNDKTLSAPGGNGAIMVTPLTTLIKAIVDQGVSVADAVHKVNLALGLDAGLNPLTFNHTASATGSGSTEAQQKDAIAIKGAIAQITTLMENVSGLIKGAAGAATNLDASGISGAVASALASQIIATSAHATETHGSPLVALGSTDVIKSVISAAASGASAGSTTPISDAILTKIDTLAGDAAKMIGALNDIIGATVAAVNGAATFDPSKIVDAFSTIAKTEALGQDTIQAAITAGAQAGSLAGAATSYTGSNLNTAIKATEIGQIADGVNSTSGGTVINEATGTTTTTPPPVTGGGGGGGGVVTVPKTFVVTNNDAGTLVFSGTATGDVTFTVASNGSATFTRGGVTATTVVPVGEITSAGGTQIKLSANPSDLSTANATALEGIDGFNANGHTFTVLDTATNLIANHSYLNAAPVNGIDKPYKLSAEVTGASVADATALAGVAGFSLNEFTYTLADTLENLQSASAEVRNGAFSWTLTDAALTAADVADATVAGLAGAQADAVAAVRADIDGATNDATIPVNNGLYTLADTLENLAAAGGTVVTDAETYALTDAAGVLADITVAEQALVAGASNTDAYTYSLADTLAHLLAATNGVVIGADSYTLTDVSLVDLSPVEVALVADASNAGDYDITAPLLTSAAVDGTALTLTYDEALKNTALPAEDAFVITVAGATLVANTDYMVTGVAGSTLQITLSSAVANGQIVTVGYTDPTVGNDTNAIQDAAGNDVGALVAQPVANNTVGDTTAPIFDSATVDDNVLVMTYGEALDAGKVPAAGDFAVTVGGDANVVTDVALDAIAKTVTLTLTTAATAGQAVTVAYTQPGDDTNRIQDAAGNDAVTLVAQVVTNNTADITAPTATIASADYFERNDNIGTGITNTIKLTGTDFSTLLEGNENGSTDIKARLDWSKVVWDINNDAGSDNVSFVEGDIDSVTVASGTDLRIKLSDAKALALYGNADFNTANLSAADGLIIGTGFLKDTAGNTATGDALSAAFTSNQYEANLGDGETLSATIHASDLVLKGVGSFTINGSNFTAMPTNVQVLDGSGAVTSFSMTALVALSNGLLTNGSSGTMTVDLSGSTNVQVAMGDGGDQITVTTGANSIITGAGDDILVLKDAAPVGAQETDLFSAGADQIQISKAVFALTTAASNVLAAGEFLSVAGGVATDAAHRIVYDSDNGNLYYDADGNGGTAAVLVVSLVAVPTLASTDIYVIA